MLRKKKRLFMQCSAFGEERKRHLPWIRRAIFVPQRDSSDCAAASLTMVARFHRIPFRVVCASDRQRAH